MLNKRHAAAQKVAAHLMPAEEDLEQTMLRNLKLQVAVMEARREANVPKDIGAVGLVHLAQAGVGLATAWKAMTDAHAAFHEDQHRIGLDAFSYGDADTTPAIPGAVQPTPNGLKQVA